MAEPLNTCTKMEQRGDVRFLWAKGMAAKDIHKEMLPMYDEHCLSRQAVHNWVQKFSDSRKGGQVSKTNIESVVRRIQGRRHLVTGAPSLQSCAYRSLHVTIKLDSAAN